jgi:Winged helix-turn helix
MAWVAVRIELSAEERSTLEGVVRSSTSEQRMVTRARVVLAAGWESNRQIARAVGLSERKVGVWRKRFAERGMAGLGDLPRPGRPARYDHDKRVEVFKAAVRRRPRARRIGRCVRSPRRSVSVRARRTKSSPRPI